jgi:hypothetical protein
MAGKKRWAHRGPKKVSKSSKQAKFAAKQKKHCQDANDAVARKRAEIEQFAQN